MAKLLKGQRPPSHPDEIESLRYLESHDGWVNDFLTPATELRMLTVP